MAFYLIGEKCRWGGGGHFYPKVWDLTRENQDPAYAFPTFTESLELLHFRQKNLILPFFKNFSNTYQNYLHNMEYFLLNVSINVLCMP